MVITNLRNTTIPLKVIKTTVNGNTKLSGKCSCKASSG